MSISRERIITLAANQAIKAGRANENELRKQIIDQVIGRAVHLLSYRDHTEDATELRKQIKGRILEELRKNIGNIANVDECMTTRTSSAFSLFLHRGNAHQGNNTMP